MFERNRIDTPQEALALPVEIETAGGASEHGKLMLARGRTVLEALNGPGPFLEFEPYGGERRFVSKSHIIAIRPVAVPKPPQLSLGNQKDGFEPHVILGVELNAEWDDVRKAYLTLSKTYHPDRFSNVDLPGEVQTYLNAMVRRINAAYAALEKPAPALNRVQPRQSQPVYTSGAKP